MHFTYIHNGLNTKQKENCNYIYHNYIWWQKELHVILNLSNLRWTEACRLLRTSIYFNIISAAADEGPDEMTCFPAGLHYLLTFPSRMSKYHRNRCVYLRTFPRKDVLIYPVIYLHICELFQKREFMNSVDPRGNTFLQGLHQQRK